MAFTSMHGLGRSHYWGRMGWLMVAAWLPWASGALGAEVGGYRIGAAVIAGGGGTSAGGAFSVTGTIGQPEAGPIMVGGNFAVQGGFWSAITLVPVPGAPALSIVHAGANTAKISWPYPANGWILQQKGALETAGWVESPLPVTIEGESQSVTASPGAGALFFRLFRAEDL